MACRQLERSLWQQVILKVSTMNYTDSNVQSGSTYYYVTTAVDASGSQSVYSDEAQAVIPMS